MHEKMTYSYLRACQELQDACTRFDWVRANNILNACDEIFGDRDAYSFEVKFFRTEVPGIAITYGDITIFFKCYKYC